MNSNFKLLLGGVIGGGVGWFVGCVIVDIIKLQQEPYEGDYYSEEYPDTREGGPETPIMMKGTTMPKKQPKNYTEIFEQRPDLKELIEHYNPSAIVDGAVVIAGGGGGAVVNAPAREEEEYEGLHDDLSDDEEEEDSDTPLVQIISSDDFINSEGLEVVTLRYYDDEVVTDRHGNVVKDPEDILGDEALLSFGILSGDEDKVYVRNLEKKAVYEVIRTNREYSVQKARQDRKRDLTNRLKKEDGNGEEHDQG